MEINVMNKLQENKLRKLIREELENKINESNNTDAYFDSVFEIMSDYLENYTSGPIGGSYMSSVDIGKLFATAYKEAAESPLEGWSPNEPVDKLIDVQAGSETDFINGFVKGWKSVDKTVDYNKYF
jgi:hypothetical protein